jgi:hypothetical protein
LKDEIITVGIVMATAFAASKIVSGVAAAIIGINTLIKAYNALKASSIIAGIASAFALNPALGVGAVALALPVLAAASKIAGMYDTKGITNEPSMGSTLDWNAIAKGSSVGGGNIDTSGRRHSGTWWRRHSGTWWRWKFIHINSKAKVCLGNRCGECQQGCGQYG